MAPNLLIAHGGGPTAVLNASLYGVLEYLKEAGFAGKALAPRFGSKGLLAEDFIDVGNLSEEELSLLKKTPGSSIGSSRLPLLEEDYGKAADILSKHGIRYVLLAGGNGTMDTLGRLFEAGRRKGLSLYCVGIPKTVDNDLGVTDHAPGFASAANFLIGAVSDCAEDVKGLPIQVSVIEAMGRNAGWLAASSALARQKEGDAPHLVYCPEIPFDEEAFLADVERLWTQKEGLLVVASEGLRNLAGEPIVKPIYRSGRAVYFGDVSAHLAGLIIERLGIKARSEKFGLLQRCASNFVSEVDREEAVLLGREAAKAALEGATGIMVGLKRISSEPYLCDVIRIPIAEVMLSERKLPPEYLLGKNNVSDAFAKWLRPLVDRPSPKLSLVERE